jgi:hypothetical protein
MLHDESRLSANQGGGDDGIVIFGVNGSGVSGKGIWYNRYIFHEIF